LLKVVEESAKPPDAVALECTIKVAQFVAASDPQQPGKFLSCLAAWVKQDPSHRWSVATWASSYLHPRWALSENSPAPGSKGSLSKEWGDPPHEPPPPLLPFIAGCDAYEWGRLAAFSAAKNSEQNATIAAAVLCQQVAEFLAAVVSPFDAAACIDAAVELMHSDDLFARKTLDLVDGFMERLRGNAERFRLVAQTDLQEYYEERTGSLSYKMGKWMELTLGDPASLARVDALDEQLGQKVRQQIETKTAEARAEASEILDNLAKLAAGKLSPDDCNGLLNRLIGANDSALERDRADAADLVTEGINIQAEKSGIAAILDQPLPTNPTLTYRTLYMTAIRQTSGVIFDVPRATENPRRQVLATFLLRRGLEPVTPTALEVYGRHPQPGRIAESIEQALSDPVATTVEAFHKALFGSSETVRTYLSPGRRIGVPRFLDVDGNQR